MCQRQEPILFIVAEDQSSEAPTSGDPQPTCNSSSRGSSALSWSIMTPALMCTYLHTHIHTHTLKKINVFKNYQKSDSVSLLEALSHHCPSQTSGAGTKDSLGSPDPPFMAAIGTSS